MNKENTVSKKVTLYPKQIAKIAQFANDEFEGNESMALRKMIDKTLCGIKVIENPVLSNHQMLIDNGILMQQVNIIDGQVVLKTIHPEQYLKENK